MSELPQSPLVSESNPAATPTPAADVVKPNWLNPLYAWKHNRWLFLAYISVVIIVLLIISLVVVLIYSQLSVKTPPDPEPATNQADQQPVATHNPDDDKFFAEQSLTMIYYSFAQTTSSKNMYQATPSDQENRVLDIGYPDKYQFSTSPDGAWLIRWNDTVIEKAAAATPQKFTSIFDISSKSQKLTSVVWQGDSAALAIATNQTTNSQPHNLVTILPLITLQSIVVYDEPSDFNLEIVRFPTATELYFVENRNSVKHNLTLFNPQSKAIERQFTALNKDNLLETLQLSQDMKFGYRSTETQVIRYNLRSMEQSVLYTTDRHCAIGQPNNNTIAFTTVSPSGNNMLIAENLTQCPQQVRNRNAEPTPVPPTQQTTLYSLADQKVLARKYNLGLTQSDSSSWSPGEEYIWLAVDTQHAYTVGVSNLEVSPVPSTSRHVITRERVFILGWLKP